MGWRCCCPIHLAHFDFASVVLGQFIHDGSEGRDTVRTRLPRNPPTPADLTSEHLVKICVCDFQNSITCHFSSGYGARRECRVRERAISQFGCLYRNTLLDASQREKSQEHGTGVRGGSLEVQFLVSSFQFPVSGIKKAS
jgi:hypothetical protein